MRILLLSQYDQGGGAERVAFDLTRAYRSYGHEVRLIVERKRTTDENVIEADVFARASPFIPCTRSLFEWIERLPKFKGQSRLSNWVKLSVLPQRWINTFFGYDDFEYPYSWFLLDHKKQWVPDIIHAHNLHGHYFDLRALSYLSWRVPFVWTLHDAWALTGHCAHFVDINCSRWQTGCGECPDLKRPPEIRKDRTAENWQRKREIYTNSRLAVASPSQWLLSYLEKSILRPGQKRVIPNGVSLDIFHPGDRNEARKTLCLPQESFICLFVASMGNAWNPYKDYSTTEAAILLLANKQRLENIIFLCIGDGKAIKDSSLVRYTGYIKEPRRLALHYQAADVLIHSANIENYPLVILEAMACGLPVIASKVGGILEQVSDGETGFLVPSGDCGEICMRVSCLISNPQKRHEMSEKASQYAKYNYDIKYQTQNYMNWFELLLSEYNTARRFK